MIVLFYITQKLIDPWKMLKLSRIMGNDTKSNFPSVMWPSAHKYFYVTLNH
jgi:hypothetical protein